MSVRRGLGECPGSTKMMLVSQEDDGAFILNAKQRCCISLEGAVLSSSLRHGSTDECRRAHITLFKSKFPISEYVVETATRNEFLCRCAIMHFQLLSAGGGSYTGYEKYASFMCLSVKKSSSGSKLSIQYYSLKMLNWKLFFCIFTNFLKAFLFSVWKKILTSF